jgi:zinc protease
MTRNNRHNATPVRIRWMLAAAICPVLLMSFSARASEPLLRVLPNGMTVVLQENHTAPVVSIQAWVRTGSAREKTGEIGMAHVLEHMLFKGTESRGVGVIAREVESAGGEINAYTTWDTTVFYINMASRFMDKGIDILADLMQSAAFDPGELAKESLVILEEIRRGKDMPDNRLSEMFFSKAYTVHPYGRPVIGYEETVREFTREGLLAFYRKWYVPEDIVWVMTGDLRVDELLPRLEARLSKLPARPAPVRVRTIDPPQSEPKIFVMPEDVQESRLRIGFHIPGISNPDVPALDLLAGILGDGKSSRLYNAFRMKERLVNSISAYSMTPEDPGLFIVTARLESKEVERALPEIIQTILRSGFDPIGPEELNTAKARIESDFIYQMETVQGQARELGYFATTLGDLNFGKQYLKRIRSTTADDLQRVARTYLRPGNMTVGVLVPQSDGNALEEKKVLKQVEHDYAGLESRWAKKETSAGQRGGAISKIELANGATLLIRENRAVPLVSMSAVFLGGLLSENQETSGIGNFTAAMLTKGTSSRTAQQIAQEIESLAGSISGFSGKNAFGLTSDVVSWNFAAAFEIFTDVLLHPKFPEDQLEKTRRDILAAIKNQQDNVAQTAFTLFWKSLYPCHPYGMDPLGTPETIVKIGRQDLMAYYGRETVASNLVLSVVGDVKVPDVRERVERSLAVMPQASFQLPEETCQTEPKRLTEEHVSPDKLQAHVIVGARGARYEDKDRYSLDVLQAILSGQGGRLFVELRDQKSLAYTVTAFSQEAYDPGAFGVYLATKPENHQTAVQGIRDQLQRVREEKVSAEELERAKNYVVGSYDLSIQTNSSQASLMALFERYGLGYDSFLTYPEKIQKVTAGQVRKAARKYLCPQCLVEVLVVPEENGKGKDSSKNSRDETHPEEGKM